MMEQRELKLLNPDDALEYEDLPISLDWIEEQAEILETESIRDRIEKSKLLVV